MVLACRFRAVRLGSREHPESRLLGAAVLVFPSGSRDLPAGALREHAHRLEHQLLRRPWRGAMGRAVPRSGQGDDLLGIRGQEPFGVRRVILVDLPPGRLPEGGPLSAESGPAHHGGLRGGGASAAHPRAGANKFRHGLARRALVLDRRSRHRPCGEGGIQATAGRRPERSLEQPTEYGHRRRGGPGRRGLPRPAAACLRNFSRQHRG
mmetsp:Transcript_41158/g.81861  ORF Transcript_41158/g.81861 Transcript_41158/m.81861 type:complete len:208 (+) Transcript_41158:699-1322(+)